MNSNTLLHSDTIHNKLNMSEISKKLDGKGYAILGAILDLPAI